MDYDDIDRTHDLYGDFSREEAVRRFPEVEDITDDELREQVIDVLRNGIPDYFWTAPAASRHHPRKHRARHGLWLHTKRVCTELERFGPSMVKQSHMTWAEMDHMRAACILHDMFKYGYPPTSVDSVVSNHDTLAANWLSSHTELDDDVIGAVESHNGAWYVGPPPSSSAEQTMHIADLGGSDENNDIAVKDPHPVLQNHFPSIRKR